MLRVTGLLPTGCKMLDTPGVPHSYQLASYLTGDEVHRSLPACCACRACFACFACCACDPREGAAVGGRNAACVRARLGAGLAAGSASLRSAQTAGAVQKGPASPLPGAMLNRALH